VLQSLSRQGIFKNRFSPDGSSFITTNDPHLFGPFGLTISGTDLPGGPSSQDVPEPLTLLSYLAFLGGVITRKHAGAW
jgi:hypothetical protein